MVALVWLCFMCRGVFYSAVLPLWEGYDEYSHFAYIQHLTAGRGIPIPGQSRYSLEISRSMTQSPMPWTGRGVAGRITYDDFWKLPPDERARRTAPLRAAADPAGRAEDPLGELLYESQQPPLYFLLMAPVARASQSWSLATRVFLLRCASLLLCSFALPLGFATARRVFRSEEIAIAIIAIVACMPEAMIDFARSGNESLALLVYTALLYGCVRLLDEGPDLRGCVIIGVSLGCGLLTKAYFLTAIPAVCVAYALAARWSPKYLAASLAIAAAIGGWWYRFIHAVTGDFTGQIQSVSLRAIPLVDRLRVALHLDWLRAIDMALFSYIWFGGWSFLQIRSWMYHLFYAVGAAAAVGLAMLVLRSRKSSGNPRALWLMACFCALFCASLAYMVTLGQIAYGQPMTAGWYLYCLVIAEIILLCAGLMALLPWRHRMWAPLTLTGLFALLDLYGMHFILMPYYLGLTAHNAQGRLPAFHPAQGWPDLGPRILLNAPYLGSAGVFYGVWALYVAATLTCVWIVVDIRHQHA
ncbi:MAG: hypothetical protein JWP63_5162 [Candidatus Solibacter sp.]|nr:hypothetical protein [Candidatus Solibacter sp.]